MPGNPKTSKWYSTPNAKRKRKSVFVSLSPEALAKLDQLVEASGGGAIRSQIVERLILEAKL